MSAGHIGMATPSRELASGDRWDSPPVTSRWKNSKLEFIYCALVLFYVVLLLANDTYNPFIYFRF